MNYRDCSKCRFSCSVKITEEQADNIFNTFYQLGSYEKQRNFICQHVEQNESRRCTTNRKEHSNAYLFNCRWQEGACMLSFLPWYFGYRKKSSRVFFEVIIVGTNPPINKTPEDDRNFIRGHIQSFPTVASHYTIKDSNRLYLNPDLSIKNMHQLYEEEYHKKGKKPCNVNAYTDIFCEEFNLAFHKPQKDQCSSCTMYYEKMQ
jgi:hypothetical protein